MRVHGLRCEYYGEALGIEQASPRLSWRLEGARRGARQTAYQIRVARSAEELRSGTAGLWDSGKVTSDQSILLPYEGPALDSGERAYWTVTAWDENDQSAEADDLGWWEMGLLKRSDWQAEWIGTELAGSTLTTIPCPFLRCGFTVDKPIAKARLYATALGLYECRLNGAKVGADELTPGWTDYKTRVHYQTYDVTGQIREGDNVLGAILGDGWYCGHIEWRGRQRYGDKPQFFGQLVLTFEDGSTQVVATDGSWKYAFGPLVEGDLLMGESYDARLEFPGWDAPGFEDSHWSAVHVFEDSGVSLNASRGPMVCAIEELKPKNPPHEIRKWPVPDSVFDFGQNLVGKIRVTVRGEAGSTLKLRYAEVRKGGPLATSGPIYIDNLRSARQQDVFTLKGDPEGETFETRFTFHGFRYVEASSLGKNPEILDITAIVLHSDIPKTGDFECSDPLINQLQKNIDWGQRGNYVEVPTDCPQRDERLGWTGDAQVFARTAAFNRDVAGFFWKWLQDLRDSQGPQGEFPSVSPNTGVAPGDGGPAWADAGVICPWTIYLCYGDPGILAESYDSMCRFIGYLAETSRDYIRCYDDYPHFKGFGDWLALDGGLGNVQGRTPKDLVGTAFFAHSTDLLSRIAYILGKEEDGRRYRDLFEKVRGAFQTRYITAAGLLAANTQTACVLALYFDLLSPEHRPIVATQLVRDIKERGTKLSTGFTSSHYVTHVLTETGHLDVAYALLHQKGWPSWLYAVTQGATTIWERWDAWTPEKGYQDPGMNSFNHYAYGAVGAWLYETVAGIGMDPAHPGYKHIIFRPLPGGGLTYAKATLRSVHGPVESHWRTLDSGDWEWQVTIPTNTTATALVPCAEGATVIEAGSGTPDGMPAEGAEGVTYVRREAGADVYTLQSGSYRFLVRAGQ